MASADEIMSALGSQADELERQRQAKMAEAISMRAHSNPYEQAIIGLGPVLAGGLLGGKRGLWAGATGGAAGLKQYKDQNDANYELGLKAALAEASDLSSQRNDVRGQFQDIQKGGVEHAWRMAEAVAKREATANEPLDPLTAELMANNVEATLLSKDSTEEEKERVQGVASAIRAGGLTAKQAVMASRALSMNKDIQGEKRRQDLQEMGVQQRRTYGTELIDPNIEPTPKDTEEVKESLITTEQFVMNANNLKQSLLKNGDSLTGSAAVDQIQAMANLVRLQKERFGAGAALTELEAMLFKGLLPALKNNPMMSLAEALRQQGQGRNPIHAIDNMINLLSRENQILLKNRNQRLTPERYSEIFGGAASPSGNGGTDVEKRRRELLARRAELMAKKPQ